MNKTAAPSAIEPPHDSAPEILVDAYRQLLAGHELAADGLYALAAAIKPKRQMRAYWPLALITGKIGEEWATPSLKRVDLHINQEQPDRARAILSGIANREHKAQVLTAFARLALSANAAEDALAFENQAQAVSPSSAYTAIIRGAALLATNRTPEALHPLKLAANAGRMGAYFLLGLAHQRLRQPAAAVAAYRKGFKFDPEDVGPANNLFSALLEDHKHHDVVAHADAMLAAKPGHTTSMAYKYLALGELGLDRHMVSLAPEFLIERNAIATPTGYPDIASFHQALADEITHDTTFTYQRNTTRLGYQTYDVSNVRSPALRALNAVISAVVRQRIGCSCARSGHTFDMVAPADFRLNSWGVVLETGGYQAPHFHPHGWLSGVYYIEIPDDIAEADPKRAGWIEFGRGEERWNPSTTPMPTIQVKPHEGILLTFPSFYWHNTRPLASRRRRISFAFDAIPQNN